MSLIQEALKRQQQETAGNLPPKTTTPPAPSVQTQPTPPSPEPTVVAEPIAPPPPPVQPAASTPTYTPQTQKQPIVETTSSKTKTKKKSTKKSNPKKSKNKNETGFSPEIPIMIILVTLLLASLGGIITYGIHYFGKNKSTQDSNSSPKEILASTNSTTVVPVAGVESPAISTENNAPGKQITTALKQAYNNAQALKDQLANEKSFDNSKHPTKNTLSSSTVKSEKPVNTIKTVKPVLALEPKVPLTPPASTPEPKPPVSWPEVTLKGIVGNNRGGSVMINNSIVGVNDKIGGILIVSIESNGVWLEYKNERRFLKVGRSLQ